MVYHKQDFKKLENEAALFLWKTLKKIVYIYFLKIRALFKTKRYI